MDALGRAISGRDPRRRFVDDITATETIVGLLVAALVYDLSPRSGP